MFGIMDVLCRKIALRLIVRSSPLGEIRRFENVVVDLEDKASEKCCKSIASSLWCFLEKSFCVPKVVPNIF